MNNLFFLKYGGIISVPLFSLIALILISKTNNFSFSSSTVSKSIHLLEKSSYKTLFKINFLLKSFLDLCFSLYVINYLRISLLSFLGLSLIFEPIFFGLLAYYTEKKNSFLHGVFIYGSVFFFLIYQVLLSLLIKNQIFIIYTCIQAILSFFIAFGSLFYKRTNVYIQIICVSVSYVWMLIFVFNYL
ncbi:MAG: hypothetical protein UR89_C0004G0019 [Candidatus Roizmanbacteria bacterium GW2011_GWA2_35_8]|uniref:Uncharacterized protein n=1 Tax=Candidatus Roizmanbacteria bacterium GW2011_GWA2_35_8 TaxID=1618479 RepID=A0A0G0FI96_9BACT|nr:MAG: hypothetical protein UR89_C0004G0019 [Candidatus Roizmanbacteria bacterium GW2011_GWA2_35_8]